MKNILRITNIEITSSKIVTKYEVGGDWECLFNKDIDFYVEYRVDVQNTPKSVAVIPSLGTFITLSWLFDGTVVVEELDKDFYESIPEIKEGYRTMYPNVNFGGDLQVKKIVENHHEGNMTAQLFSGGLDAFDTMLAHIDEKPKLISVWGADIAVDNNDGWSVVENHIKYCAEKFDLSYDVIKSNLREILTDKIHSTKELLASGDGWWHGFHHGTGMLTLVAPLAFYYCISTLYIASSYTQEQWGTYTCSSDPIIDNVTRFATCHVKHDSYENTRQDKVRRICEYSRKHNINVPIRVCWESTDGDNCCACEKCCRTMLEFYAQKEDPANYGFSYNHSFNKTMKQLKYYKILSYYLYDANITMRDNYKKTEVIPALRWVYTGSFTNSAELYRHKRKKWDKNQSLKYNIYSLSPLFVKKIYNKLREK